MNKKNTNPKYEVSSAEEQLRREQLTLSEMVEQAPFGIYVIDSAFHIAHMNIGSQNGAFKNVRPLIGRDFAEAMHILWPESVAEGIISSFRHTLETGEPYYSPVFINPRNDVEIIEAYEWELHRIMLPDGNGVICYYFDSTKLRAAEIALRESVTERKHAEDALKESQDLYMELVANARTIILKQDTKGNLIFFNEFAQNFFGYSEKEIIGKKAVGTIVPVIDSTGRHLDEMIENITENPDKYSININENIKKNGEKVWVEWHNKALFNKDGTRAGHVAIGIDITDRIKAQNELRDSKEKLEFSLDSGNIGIWEWDLKTNEVNWDARMEKMFGLQSGTFEKTYNAFENLVHEEDLSHIQKSIRNSLEKNLPLETLFRVRSKSQKTKFISAKGFLNNDIKGNHVSFTGVCIDVTGLQEGTEQLISKLNEELLRSNKELESFAYIASHDLQEPLRMVTSFTQLLSQQYSDKLDSRAQEYINYAVDGAKRMYDLLNSLLAYSRIQTKGKSFYRVELSRILDTTKKNLALKIKERDAVIKSDGLPVVFADEGQMIQLFQNLITNSLKFCIKPPGIYISSKENGDHYIISVRDNGIGIERQYFDRIFVIFQRLFPKGGEYEGTGIGLAICRRIVERHGGKIWVESEPDKGSTFLFTIPKIDSE